MDEKKIQELLQTERPLTSEEEAMLESWYDQFAQHEELTFDNLSDKNKIRQEVKDAIFSKIDEPVPLPKRTMKLNWVRSMAAAVLLLAGITALVYLMKDHGGADPAQMAYIETTAPAGKEHKQVTLPDSSTVWLFAGTTLKYPEKFDQRQRNVELVSGMAYFIVKPDPGRPFTVVTQGDVKTTVLGTSFNIGAYKASDKVSVSVVEGKVRVAAAKLELGNLTADQQIIYNKTTGQSKLQHVDARMLVDWINGNVVLQDAGFDEVAEILEAIYRVKIVYNKAAMSQMRFTFLFSKESPVTVPLNIMKDLGSLEYTIREDTITVREATRP